MNASDAELRQFAESAGSLEARLAHGLSRVAMAARHRMFREVSTSGLSVIQSQLLAVLTESGATGVGEVAARLGVTASTVSESASALERRGLVRRERDGRRVALALTPRGKRLSSSLAGWPDFLAACLDELSADEKRVLLRAVLSVVRRLQREGVVQQARICPSCVYFRPNVHRDAERPHHCELVNLPFGDTALRLDCPDHRQEREPLAEKRWCIFTGGKQ